MVVVTIKEWHGWHYGLFLWGLGVAVAGLLYAIGSERLALKMFPDASEADRARLRSRQRVIEICILIESG
jgi:hypothetical protein